MRLVAKMKLGYYPLPVEHGPNIRARLSFPGEGMEPAAALDPCAGTGAALKAITSGSDSALYAVELDVIRANMAAEAGIQTIHGNMIDVRIKRVQTLSLLYLNPPYDNEMSSIERGKRMESVFLSNTYAWLKTKGILVMVIPGKAVDHVSDTLSSRFRDVRIYRMDGELARKYDQYAIFCIRHDNYGKDAEMIKSEITYLMRHREQLPVLSDKPDAVYNVPSGADVQLSYVGIPFDEVEDRLNDSGAWKNTAPMVLPKLEIVGGRPLTPLHGGHVAVVATAGMINGVFGEGEEKHIARWRPVKHTTVLTEKDGNSTVTRTKERFSHELSLVFVTGETLVLNENDRSAVKPEEEQDVTLVASDSSRVIDFEESNSDSQMDDEDDDYEDDDEVVESEDEPAPDFSTAVSRLRGRGDVLPDLEASEIGMIASTAKVSFENATQYAAMDRRIGAKRKNARSSAKRENAVPRGYGVVVSRTTPAEIDEVDDDVDPPAEPVPVASVSFDLGRMMMTRGVQEIVASGFNIASLIGRHAKGDWGDLSPRDKRENSIATSTGDRILSSYNTPLSPDGKIWIITEADRSVTTVLLPSEY